MMKFFLLIIISVNVAFVNAQLNIEWQKCVGGAKDDRVDDVIPTSDGGFILSVRSKSNDGDFIGNYRGEDVCLLKLDKYGKKEWQKNYGGSQYEILNSFKQTSDGGYIFSATTSSFDGDVMGHHGNDGNSDAWIVKVDAFGSIIWQKCIGDKGLDGGSDIIEAFDKGYIFSVYITPINQPMISQLIKFNINGEIEWQKNIEGSKIVKTTDGNYFIYTESNWSKDADIRYWKINQQGEILWEKKIGGSATDFAKNVQQTSDGGYILTGLTLSNDGDVSGNHGIFDAWLVKLNSNGEIQWQKCIGGTGYEESDLKVFQIKDGGYLVSTDYTYSSNGNFIGSHGESDIWIAKLNDLGVILW